MFINLTPHEIIVRTDAGDIKIPPSGKIARVEEFTTCASGEIEGIPFRVGMSTTPVGIPDREDGKVYIVSRMVLDAMYFYRDDVFAPDTGPESVIRNEKGQIVAVRRFVAMNREECSPLFVEE